MTIEEAKANIGARVDHLYPKEGQTSRGKIVGTAGRVVLVVFNGALTASRMNPNYLTLVEER